MTKLKARSARGGAGGFTLLELIVVVIIFAVVATLIGTRAGAFGFYSEEGTLRRISETISFLHYQALADQRTYQLELDLGENSFKVGQLTDVGPPDPEIAKMFQDAGILSLDLALMLNPSINSDQIFSEPEGFPSLSQPNFLPGEMRFTDVRTMRGVVTPPSSSIGERNPDDPNRPGVAYIRFSPRGFSEFAVIHIRMGNQREVSLLVNPFTGETSIIRGYKDFEWTYGKRRRTDDSNNPRGLN